MAIRSTARRPDQTTRAPSTGLPPARTVPLFCVAGVSATFAFQVVYNVGMVAGLVPVKGLPLPLMSYGGSSMVSSLVGIGLVLSVRMRRFAN